MVTNKCSILDSSSPLHRFLQPPELQHCEHAVERRGRQHLRDELRRTGGQGQGICRAGALCSGSALESEINAGVGGLGFTQVYEADGPLPPA